MLSASKAVDGPLIRLLLPSDSTVKQALAPSRLEERARRRDQLATRLGIDLDRPDVKDFGSPFYQAPLTTFRDMHMSSLRASVEDIVHLRKAMAARTRSAMRGAGANAALRGRMRENFDKAEVDVRLLLQDWEEWHALLPWIPPLAIADYTVDGVMRGEFPWAGQQSTSSFDKGRARWNISRCKEEAHLLICKACNSMDRWIYRINTILEAARALGHKPAEEGKRSVLWEHAAVDLCTLSQAARRFQQIFTPEFSRKFGLGDIVVEDFAMTIERAADLLRQVSSLPAEENPLIAFNSHFMPLERPFTVPSQGGT